MISIKEMKQKATIRKKMSRVNIWYNTTSPKGIHVCELKANCCLFKCVVFQCASE